MTAFLPRRNKMPKGLFDPQKVVFLDRDGVINRDSPEYVKHWDEFFFIPDSLKALALLAQNGFSAIIITNQSAVNRKLITIETLASIHARMQAVIQSSGGHVADIFYCPHRPEECCDCRKPRPGMIHQARNQYRINLASACMVGDSAKDILCAQNAGCGRSILVKTGDWKNAEKALAEKKTAADHVARNLNDAVRWIISHHPWNAKSLI
jgi:D-glycero-D-manno-heptose 1,7-bisphosphate phosphatase